jgi:hypothetical protein
MPLVRGVIIDLKWLNDIQVHWHPYTHELVININNTVIFFQTPVMIPTPEGWNPLAKLCELSREDQLGQEVPRLIKAPEYPTC